jgi:hypothetical protein
MQLNNLPPKIQEAFGINGQRNAIPVASQVNVTPGAASFNDGFPPATMQPISSGGVPPSGKDVNGILYAITAVQQWQCAGGQFQFDAAFAAANGGYPKGAILLSADGTGLWMNTSDGNSTNPDATDGSAANWFAINASGFTSITGLTSGSEVLTTAQWGKPAIFFSGALTGNAQMILPAIAGMRWTVMNNTTGAYSLTVKTAAGSGVVIPQGQAQGVLCDGTNIRPIGWANGEAIDGSIIGANTPAAATFTTATFNGGTTFKGQPNVTTPTYGINITNGIDGNYALNITNAANTVNAITLYGNGNANFGGTVTAGDSTLTGSGQAQDFSGGTPFSRYKLGTGYGYIGSAQALAGSGSGSTDMGIRTDGTLRFNVAGNSGLAGSGSYYMDASGLNQCPVGANVPAAITGTSIHASGGHINLDNGYYLNTRNTAGLLGALIGMDASNITRLYANGGVTALQFDAGGNGNATFNGVVKYNTGTWSAPASGTGIAYGHANWGMTIGGKGSQYDVAIANSAASLVMAVPTGGQRIMFNGTSDDGVSSGIFGGPVAVGAASESNQAAQLGQALGYAGQSYQNVLASRALATTYTNSTGRPILVFVGWNGALQEDVLSVSINGAAAQPFASGNGYGGGVFIVPPGQTYNVTNTMGSTGAPQYWNELR